MAMIRCAECAQEISDTADACPKCGAKLKKSGSLGKVLLIAVGGVVGIFVIALIAAPSNEQRQAAYTKRVTNALAKRRSGRSRHRAEALPSVNLAVTRRTVALLIAFGREGSSRILAVRSSARAQVCRHADVVNSAEEDR